MYRSADNVEVVTLAICSRNLTCIGFSDEKLAAGVKVYRHYVLEELGTQILRERSQNGGL